MRPRRKRLGSKEARYELRVVIIWFPVVDNPIRKGLYLVCAKNDNNPPATRYAICFWYGKKRGWEPEPFRLTPTHWAYMEPPEEENLAIPWNT
jgi:hypothetical protein